MKKRWIQCVAILFTLAAFSDITTASPLQSLPSKQAQNEAEILDLPELVARIKPSVVTILIFDAQDKPAGQGSGFFISEDRVVTNNHVIRGAARAEIKLASGTTIEVAGLLAFDENHDLALLKVDLSTEQDGVTIKPLKLAAKMPREGERVAVIGSPRGLEQTVSEGIVSAIREIPGFGKIIQMTAAISPGSSGSPVLNMRGEVIAVARSIVVDAQNLNFAVAIEHVAAMQAGKLRRLSELNRQWKESSDEAEEELARGVAAFLANDYQKALVHFRRAAEIKPDVAEVHYDIGIICDKLDLSQDAIAAYKRAIRIKPDFAKAYYNLGVRYSDMGRYLEEIAAYKQAIRIKPDLTEAHSNLGVAYGELGQFEEKIAAYEQAIRIDPDYAEAHFNLGVSYADLDRDQEAIAAYKEAIRIKPDMAGAHMNLGIVYGKLGRLQEAIKAYKQAIRIKPDYAKAHFNLGIAYGRLDRFEEAIDALKQAIRIQPNYAQAHLGLGMVFLKIGDRGSALDEYKILKELDKGLADQLFNFIYK